MAESAHVQRLKRLPRTKSIGTIAAATFLIAVLLLIAVPLMVVLYLILLPDPDHVRSVPWHVPDYVELIGLILVKIVPGTICIAILVGMLAGKAGSLLRVALKQDVYLELSTSGLKFGPAGSEIVVAWEDVTEIKVRTQLAYKGVVIFLREDHQALAAPRWLRWHRLFLGPLRLGIPNLFQQTPAELASDMQVYRSMHQRHC